MKYTLRVDGKERANLLFRMSLTREELADYNRRAKQMGYKNYRKFVQSQVGAAFLKFEVEWEEYEREMSDG